MSRRDEALRLRHILDYATEAIQMAQGRRREDLDTDRQFALALTRLVEIIGEAAARVSQETRAKFPSVPWQDITGMRNRLVHAYDEVDYDILWDVVQYDLPNLVDSIKINR